MKLPAIQFYPGDWRKDPGVQALDLESKGAWMEILIAMHESDERGMLVLNGKPMPNEALAQILGVSIEKTKQIVSKIISYGVASVEQSTGILYCRRMLKDEKLRQIRADCGKQGGSKAQAVAKQKSTPSFSSSISPSSSTSFSDQLQGGILFEQIWSKYPKRDGRKAAERHFYASIESLDDWQNINKALDNYLICRAVKRGYIKNGSTWFNNWQDWIDYTESNGSPVSEKQANNIQRLENTVERLS